MANNDTADNVARILAVSALDGNTISSSITVAQDVGGVKAGTTFAAGTPTNEILAQILSGSGPAVEVTIYYGAKNNPPINLEGLTSKQVSLSELLNGFKLRIIAGDAELQKGQYPIIALPQTYTLTKWFVEGLPYNIPFTTVSSGEYNIYHLDDTSYDVDENPPGIEYSFTISG